MSPDRPTPDVQTPNPQLSPHFTHTPGLTPIPSSFPTSPNSNLHRTFTVALTALYTSHHLTATRHLGLFHAGSKRWTSLPDRPLTLVCVCELLTEQMHHWRTIDASVRALLRREGLSDVPVRYYKYWTPCTFHLGEPDEATAGIFPEGPDGWTPGLAMEVQYIHLLRMRADSTGTDSNAAENEATRPDLPAGERRAHSSAATRVHARNLARGAARERAASRAHLATPHTANTRAREALVLPPSYLDSDTPPRTPPALQREDSSRVVADSATNGAQSVTYRPRTRGAARVARLSTGEVNATPFSAVVEGVAEGDARTRHWAEAQPPMEQHAAAGSGGARRAGVANGIPEYDPTPRLGLREMAEQSNADREGRSEAQSAERPPARRTIAQANTAPRADTRITSTSLEGERGSVLPWHLIDNEGGMRGSRMPPPRTSTFDQIEAEEVDLTRYPASPPPRISRASELSQPRPSSEVRAAAAAEARAQALAREAEEAYRLYWPHHPHPPSPTPRQPSTTESQTREAPTAAEENFFQRDRTRPAARDAPLDYLSLRIQLAVHGTQPPPGPAAHANMSTDELITAHNLPDSFRIFDGGPVPSSRLHTTAPTTGSATPRTLPTSSVRASDPTTDPYATLHRRNAGDERERAEGAWPPVPFMGETERTRREEGLMSPFEESVLGRGEGG